MGENFDDEKHSKTPSKVSININKRQPQNKNHRLYFTGSKASLEQMEEILNNRRHKKLTRKLRKDQASLSKDGTNFEEVLIEKMEQDN